MNNSLFRNISFGVACALGLGIAVGVNFSNNKDYKEVKADIVANQLYVGGVDITTQTDMKIGDDDHYAQLVGNVLTLHDYSYNGRGGICDSSSRFAGIYYKGTTDLTIQLEGNNSITVVGENDEGRPTGGDYLYGLYSIQYSASITFTGDGTLDLFSNPVKYKTVGLASGLRFGGERNAASLTVDGPTLNLSCGDSVLQSFALYFNNTSNPQNGNASLNIVSGSLTATGGNAYKQYSWDTKDGKSYGIVGISDINVSGGSITGIGGYGALSAGLCLSYPNGGNTETDFTGGNILFRGDNTSEESYGIYEGFEYEFAYRLTSGVNSFQSIGSTCAQKSHIKVINEISGLGYDNIAGTGTGTKINTSTSGQSLSADYKNVIFAKLPNDYVTEPSAKAGLVYTGSAQELVNAGEAEGGTVLYKLDDGEYSSTIPTATNIGNYTVYYKVNGGGEYEDIAENSVAVSIGKGESVYTTTPTAKTGLKYTNEPQVLVNAGSSSTGTVVYRIGTSGDYSETLPSATEVGAYTIYHKIIGDTNHNDSAESHFDVTISKADSYKVEPTAKTGLAYTGSTQPLVNQGELYEGEILYKLDDGDYSSTISSATEVGSYAVYYKVEEGTHHEAIAERSINVTISKASWNYINEPSAIANLKYTGSAQALVTEGTATGGTVLYKLDDSEYSEDIPTTTNVGTYTVSYKLIGDANHEGVAEKTIEVIISQNDKTELVKAITEAEALYEAIKTSHPTVASTLKTAIDAAKAVNTNPNVTVKQIADAVDALKAAIEKAKADSRDVIIDEDSGTTIKTNDGTIIPTNINLKVEVRTDVKAEEGSIERATIESKLASDEMIAKVFDVKLIKTEGGVETEIQPSEIEEGMKIIIEITIPNDVSVEGLKILHIHSESDIEFITNFEVKDSKVTFEVSKLSEMALINKKAAPTPSNNAGLPSWAIALIIIGGLFLLCFLFLLVMFLAFPRYIIDYSKKKVIRTIYVKKHYDMVLLLDTHLRKVRRHEADVYKSKEDAEKALNK